MPFRNLPPAIQKAVQEQGFTSPTQIQEKTMPLIFAGKDVIGQSETGSGKTAAFGLPILTNINHGKGVQALILTPTRELCLQVTDALRKFSKYKPVTILPVFGGVGLNQQLNNFRNADIVVATPGRLLDLLNRGCRLSTARYVVLDEADRMLDMGFIADVEKILRNTPKNRQTILFSATISPKLHSLVQQYMNAPTIICAQTHVDTSLLKEKAYVVTPQDKFSLIVHLLKTETQGIALVFCGTRHACDKITKSLRSQNIDAIAIHGGLSQSQRTHNINQMHQKGTGVLVATDVASRGLHINNISHVYNYDLPQTPDDYVHRIGRTARAGAKGMAITIITQQDLREFKLIMRDIGRQISLTPLPEFAKVTLLTSQSRKHSFKQNHGGNRSHHGSSHPRQYRKFWKRSR
ncbi:DEAD/DEAH box helicase [Candidatus Woesearchaeota archaeon]|nr:DEAD/DEAH box helicase [Candidatus Woesearchaeota archaeon]